ncbi:hypothetical protein E2C01_086530 [Portunus trituberculatus]|uniref:Uncharacterized protein n=1 Tax=Portunus trituberculatus TaxID=210409 RepID=A0A5B7J423_PORTR|nr:hypothetical protein [Portunus trituberculatus]
MECCGSLTLALSLISLFGVIKSFQMKHYRQNAEDCCLSQYCGRTSDADHHTGYRYYSNTGIPLP